MINCPFCKYEPQTPQKWYKKSHDNMFGSKLVHQPVIKKFLCMQSLTNSMGICYCVSGLNTTLTTVAFGKAFST